MLCCVAASEWSFDAREQSRGGRPRRAHFEKPQTSRRRHSLRCSDDRWAGVSPLISSSSIPPHLHFISSKVYKMKDAKNPLSPSLIAIVFAVACVHTFALAEIISILARAETWRSACNFSMAVAFEFVFLATLASIAIGNIGQIHSVQVATDRILLMTSIMIPFANVIFFFLLPSFDVTKRNWPAFYGAILMFVALVSKLPIAHLITCSTLSAPFFL